MPFVGATKSFPSPGPFRAASWPEPAPSRLQGVRLGSGLGLNREASRTLRFPVRIVVPAVASWFYRTPARTQKSQPGFDISQMQYCRSFWAVHFALACLRANRTSKNHLGKATGPGSGRSRAGNLRRPGRLLEVLRGPGPPFSEDISVAAENRETVLASRKYGTVDQFEVAGLPLQFRGPPAGSKRRLLSGGQSPYSVAKKQLRIVFDRAPRSGTVPGERIAWVLEGSGV